MHFGFDPLALEYHSLFPRLEGSRLIMSGTHPVRLLSIILTPCLTDHTSHSRSERTCDCHHTWVCGKSGATSLNTTGP